MESEANRKSISRLPTQRNSSSGFSLASQSPLRSIRRRSMKYESLGSTSNRSSLSNTDFKENSSPEQAHKNSIDSYSPLTLDSDDPIHPLHFSSHNLLQSPASECESIQTPSSVGQPSNSTNIQTSKQSNPKQTRFAASSPDTCFLRTQSFSNTKLMKPTQNIGSSPVVRSRQTSQQNRTSFEESLHSDIPLRRLDESSLSLDFRQNIRQLNNSDSSLISPKNSNNRGNGSSIRHVAKDMMHQNADDQDAFQKIPSYSRSGNELHNICGSVTTTNELMRAQSLLLGISLHRASERDYKGETILHAFSNNKVLAAIIGNPNNEDFETKNFLTLYRQPSIDETSADQFNNAVERFFVDNLLPSFFGAPIAQDNDGQIPFEAGLIDWISTCHREMYRLSAQPDPGYFSAYTNKVSDVVTHAWESTANVFSRSAIKSQRQDLVPSDLERGDSTSSAGSTTSLSVGKSKFTPHARFCLRMLSLILDEFEKFTEGLKTMDMHQQMDKHSRAVKGIQLLENVTGPLDLCGRLVEKVASIPHLLEVIFSINNETDLEFVLSTKIIKKVLIDKHSVGPWLTTMLQSPQSHISQRAIEYIHTVSRLCAGKESDHKKNRGDESKSESVHYEDLIDEVSRLHEFIPSLLALEEKVIEEVSTSLIVKEVMDKIIARPFVATVVFCDAIFLILMIVGFRAAVNGMIMGDQLDSVLRWIYVVSFFAYSEIDLFFFPSQYTARLTLYFL